MWKKTQSSSKFDWWIQPVSLLVKKEFIYLFLKMSHVINMKLIFDSMQFVRGCIVADETDQTCTSRRFSCTFGHTPCCKDLKLLYIRSLTNKAEVQVYRRSTCKIFDNNPFPAQNVFNKVVSEKNVSDTKYFRQKKGFRQKMFPILTNCFFSIFRLLNHIFIGLFVFPLPLFAIASGSISLYSSQPVFSISVFLRIITILNKLFGLCFLSSIIYMNSCEQVLAW